VVVVVVVVVAVVVVVVVVVVHLLRGSPVYLCTTPFKSCGLEFCLLAKRILELHLNVTTGSL